MLASRPPDVEDIAFLARHLGLDSSTAALAVCAAVFPDEPVPDRARLILEGLLDAPPAG